MIGSVLRVRYELTQLLAEGPIFTTYAGRDRVEGREVSVRLIKPSFVADAEFVTRLREVISRSSAIDHPGVEAIYELDEDEGTPFVIGDVTRGVPLAERIRKLAPFSVPVAVSTGISLCEALDSIHSAGLVHGDLNAQNVASLPDGQVRLQLAGIYQAYTASPAVQGTAVHTMAPYLAPEVSAGAPPTPASDVYAVGVLLYELLTGRLPYNADTPVSMALKHATGSVPSVRMYNQSVPAVLDEIVKKALAKDPAARYPESAALLGDLRVLQDALRFGRTITWPIAAPAAAPLPEPEMQKTAPVRREAPRSEPKVKEKREADVPLFMVVLIVAFLAVVLTMLGIWVAFNMNRPNLVKVPNVSGLTMDEARDLLRGRKLQIAISGEKTSDKVEEGHILQTDPESGENLRENGTVYVTLSAGSRLVPVPNLKGNTVDQARSILKTTHLDLDDNIEQRPSRTVDTGLVISQDPPSGKKLDQQSRVKIVVSSGRTGSSGGDETTPTGETNLYTLKLKLVNLEEPVSVRVEIEDDRGVRTVYGDATHSPGEEVTVITRGTGSQVTFRVYYDGELVKEVNQQADEARPLGDNR